MEKHNENQQSLFKLGYTSWEIDFTVDSYDDYYNYVKCEATGATDTSISWKSVGTYVEV